jgi:hypothetical protein
MAAFWDIALCSLLEVCRRFGGACGLHNQDDQCSVAEDTYLRTRHYDDLKYRLQRELTKETAPHSDKMPRWIQDVTGTSKLLNRIERIVTLKSPMIILFTTCCENQ